MNVRFKGFDTKKVMKQVFGEVEKSIAAKAKAAALPHGGVTVRFERKVDGSPTSVVFSGSEAAITAAKKAVAD